MKFRGDKLIKLIGAAVGSCPNNRSYRWRPYRWGNVFYGRKVEENCETCMFGLVCDNGEPSDFGDRRVWHLPVRGRMAEALELGREKEPVYRRLPTYEAKEEGLG